VLNTKCAISLRIKNIKVYIIAIIMRFPRDTHERIASSDTMYDDVRACRADDTPPPSPIQAGGLARYVSPWIYQNKKNCPTQGGLMSDLKPRGGTWEPIG
jgi:hypothetical protein